MGSKSCPHCSYSAYLTSGSWPMNERCARCGWSGVIPNPLLKSQKLKGMQALVTHFPYNTLKPYAVVLDEGDLEKAWKMCPPNSTVFVRPCPITPRHGFVESRVVRTITSLKKLWEETRVADPEGELMLSPYIKADWNMVLTPNLLTVGNGHDGATGGKNTFSLPLGGWELPAKLMDAAGLTDSMAPYFEIVGRYGSKTYFTQLRGGPKGDGNGDYIPFPTVVKTILIPDTAKGDLLEWEKLIHDHQNAEGVVVNHIGGSPIDHFSVHARTFNISVITSRKVEVGEELVPLAFVPMSPESVLTGIAASEDVDLTQDEERAQYLNLALFSLHNSGVFQGEQGYWFGLGVGTLIRLGVMALKGEARHIHQPPLEGRNTVYTKIASWSLSRLRARIPRLIHVLRYGNFSSSIGGEPWAACGAATLEVVNAVGVLAREGNQESVSALQRVTNLMVHQVHNGGWWMNKFNSSDSFTQASKNAPQLLMGLGGLINTQRWVDCPLRDKRVERYKQWTPLQPLVEVKILSALVSFNSEKQLHLAIQDHILRKARKPLYLKEVKKLPPGNIIASHTNEGVRVAVRQGEGKPDHFLYLDKSIKVLEQGVK